MHCMFLKLRQDGNIIRSERSIHVYFTISSRSTDDSGPGLGSGSVYSVEQSEEGYQSGPNEPLGKKIDKELKGSSVKGEMAESLSQYERSSYPSKSYNHKFQSTSLISVYFEMGS